MFDEMVKISVICKYSEKMDIIENIANLLKYLV